MAWRLQAGSARKGKQIGVESIDPSVTSMGRNLGVGGLARTKACSGGHANDVRAKGTENPEDGCGWWTGMLSYHWPPCFDIVLTSRNLVVGFLSGHPDKRWDDYQWCRVKVIT
ncbi:hypothetical protein SDJN03_28500, partial [Cucurbita argyrosperma subsp. sororia]